MYAWKSLNTHLDINPNHLTVLKFMFIYNFKLPIFFLWDMLWKLFINMKEILYSKFHKNWFFKLDILGHITQENICEGTDETEYPRGGNWWNKGLVAGKQKLVYYLYLTVNVCLKPTYKTLAAYSNSLSNTSHTFKHMKSLTLIKKYIPFLGQPINLGFRKGH